MCIDTDSIIFQTVANARFFRRVRHSQKAAKTVSSIITVRLKCTTVVHKNVEVFRAANAAGSVVVTVVQFVSSLYFFSASIYTVEAFSPWLLHIISM